MTSHTVLHGLDLSYFTGKVQAYLQYAEVPHRFEEMSVAGMARAKAMTGLAQMPAVELTDGRWMTDSTAIIAWYDGEGATQEPVTPRDPAAAFLAALIEDYADEWLWRPALHYRWSYPMDAQHMGRRIAAEMMRDIKLPLPVRQAMIIARQRRKYLREDGVAADVIPHIESIYLRNLDWLEAVFAHRPFLLGERPTLPDFGYFASMFRHFGLDPTPSRIMRETAPRTFAWLGRMWAARASSLPGACPAAVPADLDPILTDIGEAYLPYLAANARAYLDGKKTFELTVQGARYRLPVHRYRVWALAQLQHKVGALSHEDRTMVETRLETVGAWAPLWTVPHPDSGFDPQGLLPFLTPDHVFAR